MCPTNDHVAVEVTWVYKVQRWTTW